MKHRGLTTVGRDSQIKPAVRTVTDSPSRDPYLPHFFEVAAMTHFTLAHGQLRRFAPPFLSGAPAGRLKSRRRFLRIEGLEDRSVPATFHVSLTGDDLTGTGTIAAPFRTIQRGINEAAATADGNDFVDVAGGTYATAGVDLGIAILANPNLTNLHLLGGWDATFTTQNPAATPTLYVFQNP